MKDYTVEREELWVKIRQLKRQKTLPAIRQARHLLRQWMAAHPEDDVSADSGEELAMLEEALEIIAKEQVSEPVAA